MPKVSPDREMSPSDIDAKPQVKAVWHPQARFSYVVTDGEQIEHLNATGGIAVDFAGRPKRSVHIAFEGSQSKTLSLWATVSRFGFTSKPTLSADLFTLRFLLSGAMIRNNHRGEPVIGHHDQATLMAFEDMRDDQASAEFSAVAATISRQSMIEAYTKLNGDEVRSLPRFSPSVNVDTVGLLALRQTTISLQRNLILEPSRSDLVTPLLEELLVYQLMSCWPVADDGVGLSLKGMPNPSVRGALDYIEANLSRKMTIAEIASAAGLSVRALQIAFKRHFGHSPVKYLIDRRLDRVHADLQSSGDTTIRKVASRWGFSHMSDFSQRYRERYGHTPTVLRAGKSSSATPMG